MGRKFVIVLNFIFYSGLISASETDTLLNMVISKPYFYNVVQNSRGEIFLGTAKGILRVEGEKMSHYGSSSGYIKINAAGKPEIDSLGISSYQNRKYLHLLPYPDAKREEYHTGNENYFYIVSGGRLHIFDIEPYAISFRNQSIRSISKNLVGGYSGVYYKGNMLEFPLYTDGYIREFGDTAFICYAGLMMITPGKFENFLNEASFTALINAVDVGKVDDIYFDADAQVFILSSHTGVYLVSKNLKSIKKIFSNQKDDPIVLLGTKYNNFHFCAGNKMMGYSLKTDKIVANDSTSEKIISGVMPDKRNIYTLTSNTLYQSTTTGFFKKVASFSEAHTLLALNEKEFVISSNKGLFLFNLEKNITSAIINGVEFNRRALYLENNTLYAGSVNGLYAIGLDQINSMIKKSEQGFKSESEITSFIYAGIFVIILLALLIFVQLRLRKKLKTAEQEIILVREELISGKEKKLDREMIEQYIRANLASASIKSINEHFNTNTSQLYTLFDPEKPGTIIQKLRMELVMEMKRKGSDLDQISASSGLSKSYLKKIRIAE